MSFDAASPAISPPLRRALAVALVVAVACVILAGIVLPAIDRYQAVEGGIADSETALQRFNQVAARLPRLEAERAHLKDALAAQDGFLKATSDTLIAAEMQTRIKVVTDRAGGQLKSTQNPAGARGERLPPHYRAGRGGGECRRARAHVVRDGKRRALPVHRQLRSPSAADPAPRPDAAAADHDRRPFRGHRLRPGGGAMNRKLRPPVRVPWTLLACCAAMAVVVGLEWSRFAGATPTPEAAVPAAGVPAAQLASYVPPPEDRFAEIAQRPLFVPERRPQLDAELQKPTPAPNPPTLIVQGVVLTGARHYAIIQHGNPPQARGAVGGRDHRGLADREHRRGPDRAPCRRRPSRISGRQARGCGSIRAVPVPAARQHKVFDE